MCDLQWNVCRYSEEWCVLNQAKQSVSRFNLPLSSTTLSLWLMCLHDDHWWELKTILHLAKNECWINSTCFRNYLISSKSLIRVSKLDKKLERLRCWFKQYLFNRSEYILTCSIWRSFKMFVISVACHCCYLAFYFYFCHYCSVFYYIFSSVCISILVFYCYYYCKVHRTVWECGL